MTTNAPIFLPDGSPFRLAAVVFDFDGTLTAPGALDFEVVRAAVGCPSGVGLLEYLESLDDAAERAGKEIILEEAEMLAAGRGRPNEGAEDLVALLRSQRVPMAVISRNRREPVERALAFFTAIDCHDFALVVTRESGLGAKPLPDGVLHVAAELGVDPGEVLLIGDHAYDIEAGRRAGTLTMFLRNDPGEGAPDPGAAGAQASGAPAVAGPRGPISRWPTCARPLVSSATVCLCPRGNCPRTSSRRASANWARTIPRFWSAPAWGKTPLP